MLVSNRPIPVFIPSSFTVPLGGCSVPYRVTLSNSPYSDVKISFQYDTILYNLHLFWVNEQTSYNELEFNRTITSRWLSFCTDSTIGLTSLTLQAFLGGTNYQAYHLSNTNITINIISNSTTNVRPSFTLNSRNLQKTYAGLEVNPNLSGQIYYELKLANSGAFMNLVDLKATIKEHNLLLSSQADYMNFIYQTERYHRIGIQNVATGPNPLEFHDLLPG